MRLCLIVSVPVQSLVHSVGGNIDPNDSSDTPPQLLMHCHTLIPNNNNNNNNNNNDNNNNNNN